MSLAIATIVGNVGGDPDIRKTRDGEVCNFSVAVNGKRAGHEFTDWYRCVTFYGGLIDTIDKYVKKGSGVTIVGELGQQKWEDKDGIERTTVELLIQKLNLNDPPPGRGTGDRAGDRNGGDRGGDRGRDDRGGGGGRGRDDQRGGGRDGGGRDSRQAGRDDRSNGRGRDEPRGGYGDDGRRADDRGRGRDDTRGGGQTRGGQQYDSVMDDEIPF
jgi:single stranded DNA-binding protein